MDIGNMSLFSSETGVLEEGNDDINKVPTTLTEADVLIAELNNNKIWSSVRLLSGDPSLTKAENQKLLRRISEQIVTICQELYEHYLLKAEILIRRGVFSNEVNMCRLRTQLASDAHKFLNAHRIRGQVLHGFIDELSSKKKCVRFKLKKVDKLQLSAIEAKVLSTGAKTTSSETVDCDSHRTVEQMLNEMPTLNVDMLSDVLMSLPRNADVNSTPVNSAPATSDDCLPSDTDLQPKPTAPSVCSQPSDEVSREKILWKRSQSCLDLTSNKKGTDDLKSTRLRASCRISSANGRERRTPASDEKSSINSINDEQSHQSRCASDLRRLVDGWRKTGIDEKDEMDPLIQAVMRHAKHDQRPDKLRSQLEELEQQEKLLEEQERLVLPESEHIQPSTVTKQMSNSVDTKSVKEMDNNLVLEDELGLVYDELLKTLDTDHLETEMDVKSQPVFDDVDLSLAMASSTFANKNEDRVINKSLQRAVQKRPRNVSDNPSRRTLSHSMVGKSKNLCSRQQNINCQSYMDYLSKKDSDYMRTVFHLYDSDDELDDVNDNVISTQDALSLRLAEMRSLKARYKAGEWNVNCVMLGGLGKEPQDDMEDEQDAEKSVIDDDKFLDASRVVRTNVSYIISKKQRRLLEQLDKENCAPSETVFKSNNVQSELEIIWTRLQMPDSMKLDMAVKYSSDKYHPLIHQAVSDWSCACELILEREKMIKQLESFERLASQPSRLFRTGTCGLSLLAESDTRAALDKKIHAIGLLLQRALVEIKKKYNDILTYQGRPYLDKMRHDRVEMLYWLQEERKIEAIQLESRHRNLPPLSASVIAINP